MKCLAQVLVACAAGLALASIEVDKVAAPPAFLGDFDLLSTFEGASSLEEHKVSEPRQASVVCRGILTTLLHDETFNTVGEI